MRYKHTWKRKEEGLCMDGLVRGVMEASTDGTVPTTLRILASKFLSSPDMNGAPESTCMQLDK